MVRAEIVGGCQCKSSLPTMAMRGRRPSVVVMEFGSRGGGSAPPITPAPTRPEGGTSMSRTTHGKHNIAARMGRWSAAHWKTATFGWLAFVLVAFAVGGAVGMNMIDPN